MTFSVIVPVYNTAQYLPFAIDSVLANDTSCAEIIIVDDGSSDGITPALCDGYAKDFPDLVRVIHQKNLGLGGARNSGVKAAKGDYVIFLDSDDALSPSTISRLTDTVKESAPDVIVFGMSQLFDGGRASPIKDVDFPEGVFTVARSPIALTALPSACNKAFRRELFSLSGVEFPSPVLYEDLRTTPKLLVSARSIVFIDERLYLYRRREGSIMNASAKRDGEIIDAFNDLTDWFLRRGTEDNYYRELEKLAVDHLLIAATVRVARDDPKSPLLKEIGDYVNGHFPDHKNNPYVSALPLRHKLILMLAKRKRYRLIKLIFSLKG